MPVQIEEHVVIVNSRGFARFVMDLAAGQNHAAEIAERDVCAGSSELSDASLESGVV